MDQDAPVLEAQGLEGADLRFFAGGDAVHGRHHGQYGDSQEQHRQDGRHGLALVHLALRLRPGHGFILGKDQPGRTQSLVRLLHESGLVQIGFHVDLVVQRADHFFVQRGNGAVQHGRGNVHVAVGGIVRHHLVGIRQADQVFAGFDQAFDDALDRDGLVGQRQRIAQADPVGRGVGIGQPEAVRGGRVVGFARHQQDTRYVHVFAHRQRQGVGIALHGHVQREEACGVRHAGNGHYGLQVFFGKAFVVIDAEIGKARGVVDFPRVHVQGIPLHVEAQEHADAQRHHDDHGNELRLVLPQRAEQFFQQHYQSTSSTDSG